MINRSKMPRQLRSNGGAIGGGSYSGIPMGSRTGFGIISKIKDRVRKLIPNELASVAVKAAPFVAPFNPGIAGLMRGIGRFDQRGSFSDALKQGVGTFAFGVHNEEGPDTPASNELVRLASPRRPYTQSHFDYVGEVLKVSG